jgi:hypothetical protein
MKTVGIRRTAQREQALAVAVVEVDMGCMVQVLEEQQGPEVHKGSSLAPR